VSASAKEKVKKFDEDGRFKAEIDRTMALLRSFRKKYPFVEKPDLIDSLTPDDVFTDLGEVGDFFLWIEYHLKPIGHLYLFSKVYRKIRDHARAHQKSAKKDSLKAKQLPLYLRLDQPLLRSALLLQHQQEL
jgi:hypothetical protein